jgi:WhiB family transcriptional regulator, redox-sensing transcriptional regulator
MTSTPDPTTIPTQNYERELPADPRPAWERVAYTWLEREVDAGQPIDPTELAHQVSVAPRFADDLLRVLRARHQRDPALAELRGRQVRDRITNAYLTRELPGGERLDPTELAAEVGITATVARQWLHTLRAGRAADRRLASLRGEPVSHGHPTAEQLQALQAAYAGGGRPQAEDPRPAGWALQRIEQLYQHREIARGQPLDPAEVARQVGVSEHYVRGTLTALRGGTLTNAQRIEQLWRLWELQGGQRLAAADLARIVGVREGRVRQVLGPLRTAHRNTTASTDRGERPVVVEDDGPQAWLDRAACRDQDPERFFPESGEQVKAAEAKAICASCQVRDHCLHLAVKAADGIDGDHGIFGGTLPTERSRLRGNTFPEPSAYRQQRELAEQAHALASEVGLRQAAKRLGIHRDALRCLRPVGPAGAGAAGGLAAQPLPRRPRRSRTSLPARRTTRLDQRGRRGARHHLALAAQSLHPPRPGHAGAQPEGRPAGRGGRPPAHGLAGHPRPGPGVRDAQPRPAPHPSPVRRGAGRAGPPCRGLRGLGCPGGGGVAHRKPRRQAQHPGLGDRSPRRPRLPPPPGPPAARRAVPG